MCLDIRDETFNLNLREVVPMILIINSSSNHQNHQIAKSSNHQIIKSKKFSGAFLSSILNIDNAYKFTRSFSFQNEIDI